MNTRVHDRCDNAREHNAEAFLLDGAVSMGTWEVAGLKAEACANRRCSCVAGYWKVMRCGCVFAAVAM